MKKKDSLLEEILTDIKIIVISVIAALTPVFIFFYIADYIIEEQDHEYEYLCVDGKVYRVVDDKILVPSELYGSERCREFK